MTSKKPHPAELDRMNSKLERLAAQRKALRKAINQFGEGFDAKTWSDAFDSSDADDINRVFTVTGGRVAHNVVFADPRVFEAFDLPNQISPGEFRQPR